MLSLNRGAITALVAAAAVTIPAAASSATTTSTPAWLRALTARSVALDREYHLGRFAIPPAAGSTRTPAWLRALEVRSDAMNRRAGLGRYAAPVPTSAGFSWHDAGIGAAFSAAVCLMLGGIAFLTRERLHAGRLS
jgi:hypothetical protein